MGSYEITNLEPRIEDFWDADDDDKIKKDEAARLIGTGEDALTVLPFVETTLAPARTFDAVKDGTFMIMTADDGDYDLDKTSHKTVVDPVAVQASSGGSSSSSGCDAGAGLAVLAGLALIKRRAK